MYMAEHSTAPLVLMVIATMHAYTITLFPYILARPNTLFRICLLQAGEGC